MLAVYLAIFVTVGPVRQAFAEDIRLNERSALIFDIPAQQLASALDAYSNATGKEVFYDGSAGSGRWSVAVKGSFTPEDALSLLLSGTDLLALPSGSSGYTLVLAPEEGARVAAMTRIAADQPYARYFAVIQGGVRDALCRNSETRPGSYRVLLTFWIGASGGLERVVLKGTTGDTGRDADLSATLRAVTLAEAPPAGMPQPITMAIFPGGRVNSVVCRNAGEGRPR